MDPIKVEVTIHAPELASAIQALAAALGTPMNIESLVPQIAGRTIDAGAPIVQPETQAYRQAPVAPAPAPIAAPVAAPVTYPAAPVQVNQAVPVNAAVPTAAQSYSMEQLAVAATQLVDAGRRNELVQLLGSFGVQALTALPKEHYGTFATQLRSMGAKI